MTQPRAVHTMGTWVASITGIRRFTWLCMRRWIEPTRGLVGPFTRSPRSNPEQKWSPRPARWITRTDSSLAAASTMPISA